MKQKLIKQFENGTDFSICVIDMQNGTYVVTEYDFVNKKHELKGKYNDKKQALMVAKEINKSFKLLNETQLRKIIKESIKKVLREYIDPVSGVEVVKGEENFNIPQQISPQQAAYNQQYDKWEQEMNRLPSQHNPQERQQCLQRLLNNIQNVSLPSVLKLNDQQKLQYTQNIIQICSNFVKQAQQDQGINHLSKQDKWNIFQEYNDILLDVAEYMNSIQDQRYKNPNLVNTIQQLRQNIHQIMS